ncbi:MAG: O-antigen ligase family protein [Actinomycetota bacterium]|nr:O-antigen ligase family protein [Actinomycetota bacterium]
MSIEAAQAPIRGGPDPGRPRIALTLALLLAAMPVRIAGSFPVVSSVSVLDPLLILAAATLFLDLAFRPLDTGSRALFRLLCLPLLVAIASVVWSQDRAVTIRTVIVYAEGVVAFLFVIRELDGLSSARIITYIKRFAYLLILPAVLLELRVPGFGPEESGLKHSSGDYISYYTRLSHPVLGRSNNLAAALAFFVPVLLYWGHSRHDRRVSRAGFIVLIAIFLTLSRGTSLAFLIAGGLYLPLRKPRRAPERAGVGKIAAGVVVGAIAVVVFISVDPTAHEFIGERLSTTNVSLRSDLAAVGWTKIAQRPLLGYGAGVVPDHDPAIALGVHNTYLQQAVAFGLPLGLVVSCALWSIPGTFLRRRRTTALGGVLAYTVLVQLVGFLFESTFEGTVLRVLFYLSVGLAFALLRAVEREALAAAGQP